MRHASLFSGIGGPEVAAAMLGWENVFHCEINDFGRKVLEYWFPESDSYDDITKTEFTRYRGTIDVLTGGFPCQPFSYAGRRGGQEDQRYLWPQMLRVINEVRPTWVIGENVAGITTMVEQCRITEMGSEATLFEEGSGVHRYGAEYAFTIERICSDLESVGYSVQPMLIPACAVGAPHRRDRIFFIAYNASDSINNRVLRDSGADAAEGGKERICERNKIQRTDEPDYVRSELQPSSSDTLGGGSESYSQSQGIEGIRCDTISEPGEWSQQTEFNNGLSEFSRIASDTDCDRRGEVHEHLQSAEPDGQESFGNGRIRNAADSGSKGLEGENKSGSGEGREQMHIRRDFAGCCWKDGLRPEERWKDFPTVSAVHRGNDGIPFDVDSLSIPFSKWRTETIKAYGNAIVPQVMYRIFEAIEALQ